MKRLFCILALVAVLLPGVVALASDVSGALYQMGITMTNSGAAATNVITVASISSPNLINGGFANSGLTNIAVRNAAGADVPFMPGYETNPLVMFVPGIGANAQLTYILYTDSSTGGSLRYFPDASGMTSSDAASMEPGNSFEDEIAGFVNTTAAGVGAYLSNKPSAYRLYISAMDTVTADFYDPSGTSSAYSSTSDGHLTASGGPVTSIENLVPNAAGDYTSISYQYPASTSHYDKVDDTPGAPDNGSTYVYQQTTTQQKDSYNLQNSSQIQVGDTINSVTVYFTYGMASAGPYSISAQPFLRLSGAETAGSEVSFTADTSFTTASQVLSRPGGGGWSLADINALQAAIGIRSTTQFGINSCVTAVYIAVNYTHTVSYSSAQSQATGTVAAASTTFNVGQQLTGSTYNIWRGALYFDTSAIPDYASITGASLKLYGQADASATDFNLRVTGSASLLNGHQVYPHDPLVAGDYAISNYLGDGGSINTSGWTIAGYNTVTLNATGLGWIDKAGTTKLFLVSDRDVAATAPTGGEYVSIYAAEQTGAANDPQLVVTYKSSVSGTVSAGSHTIKATLANNVLSLYVDNMAAAVDSVTLSTYSVTNNTNNWTFAEAAAMPYMEYHKLTVAGTLKQHIAWQHWLVAGSTLTNATGIATGSPIALVYGNNTITVTQVGTFTVVMPTGFNATATSGSTTVTGSPQTLAEGSNTVTTTTATGTFTINVHPIFRDQSGNSNHAVPTFRTASSNANVSAAAVSFQPVTEAKAPAWSLGSSPDWITGPPTITGNFTSANVTPTYPGHEVIEDLAKASATPAQLPTNLISGFIILALSLSASAAMRQHAVVSLFVKGLLIGCLMGIAVAVKAYDFWMVIVFAFAAIALAVASTDPRWS